MLRRFIEFLKNIEWSWSLFAMWVKAMAAMTIPAWATYASNLFSEYSPLSWVIAGFVGLLCYSLIRLIHAQATRININSAYDKKFLQQNALINPLDKVFENQRIYIDKFALPSFPLIHDKTFVNCEIIGPANIIFQYGNNVDFTEPPVDAVYMHRFENMQNAFVISNCVFKNCTFHRITAFISGQDYENHKDTKWLNWIGLTPEYYSKWLQSVLTSDLEEQNDNEIVDVNPQDEDSRPQLLEDTEEKKQQ